MHSALNLTMFKGIRETGMCHGSKLNNEVLGVFPVLFLLA